MKNWFSWYHTSVKASCLSPAHFPLTVVFSPLDNSKAYFPSKHTFQVFFFFFFFLGPHLQHMDIPGLGVELELHLQAYSTVTVKQDPSRICDLCRSLRQRHIFNPLSEARDRTRILQTLCRILKHLSHNGNSSPEPYDGTLPWGIKISDMSKKGIIQNIRLRKILFNQGSKNMLLHPVQKIHS